MANRDKPIRARMGALRKAWVRRLHHASRGSVQKAIRALQNFEVQKITCLMARSFAPGLGVRNILEGPEFFEDLYSVTGYNNVFTSSERVRNRSIGLWNSRERISISTSDCPREPRP